MDRKFETTCINSSALQDPRMIDVLGVVMGLDMQGFSREEGSDELPPGVSKANMATPPSSPPPKPAASTSTSKPPPSAEPEDVEMTPEDHEEAQSKKDAEAAKKAGSEAYKQKDFEMAAKNFEKAWDIWPKDVTFLTNLGGVFCSGTAYRPMPHIVLTWIFLLQLCISSKENMINVSKHARQR